MGRRRRRWSLRALLLGVLLGALLGPLAAGTAQAATRDVHQGGQRAASPRPTVVVAVGGLSWSDVDSTTTPALWRLVGSGAAGSMSVHTVGPRTCLLDSWLTLSAGRHAAGHQAGQACPAVPGVQRAGSGARVDGWSGLVSGQQTDQGDDDRLGLLGDRLAARDVCSTAVGPGAAIALARSDGAVARYAPRVTADALTACPVTVVDAGDLLGSDTTPPTTTLGALDDEVAKVVRQVRPGTRVVVAGIADVPTRPPGLQVVVRWQKGEPTPSWLTSGSTRRTGIVQIADVTASVLSGAGANAGDLDGKPMVLAEDRRTGTSGTIHNREDMATLATVVPEIVRGFGGAMVVLQVVVYALALLLVGPRRLRPRTKPWVSRVVYAVTVFAASACATTYLCSLTRWWTYPNPSAALAAWSLATTVVLAAVCILVSDRWRVSVATLVAGVTFGVLTLDGFAGTPLQYGSVLVAGPAIGGRFYGFNNATYAIYATSALLLAGGVAGWLLRRGLRRQAVLTVLGIGLVAVVVDGEPAFGADFGGVLGLIPGVAVLAFAVRGRRVTAGKVLATAGVAVAAVTAIAVADWLRPADQRTHLGDFVARVLAGDAGDLLLRKAYGSLSSLWYPVFGPLGVVTYIAAVILVVRPAKLRIAPLVRAYAERPLLKSTLVAVLVTSGVGSVVNDTGVVIPGLAIFMTVPLVVAICLGRPPRQVDPAPGTGLTPAAGAPRPSPDPGPRDPEPRPDREPGRTASRASGPAAGPRPGPRR